MANKIPFTIDIDRSLRAEIRKRAKLLGMKIGPLCERLLRDALEPYKPPTKEEPHAGVTEKS